MRKKFLLPLLCLGFALSGAPNPEKVAAVKAGRIDTAYASWWGFDETDSAEFLQAAIDSGAKKVIVDYTGKDWITGKTLILPSNLELVIADKVTLKAKRWAFKGLGDSLFKAPGTKNTILRGEGSAKLMMNRKDYLDTGKYRRGAWRHIIYLQGVSDFTIRDLFLTGAGGDGIYVGAGPQPYCRNVHIENITADDCNRLGMAVISAENLVIRNCRFTRAVGTSPAGGIDFEPNRPVERLVNCLVENCLFENNRGAGICVSPNHLNKDSLPVSITFRNCRSVGNGLGVFLYPSRDSKIYPVKGKVEFISCEFLNSGNLFQDPVTKSVDFFFRNCKFAPSRKETAGINIVCKYAEGREIGGLHFENCTMTCGSEKVKPITLLYQGTGDVSDQITGSLDVIRNGKTERFDFPAFVRERQAYFSRINHLKPVAGVDLGGLKRMKQVRERFRNEACLRGTFTYVQYAGKGESVTVNARIISGGYPGNVDIELKAPDGKRIRKYSFPPDGKDHPISFTANETGYYTLTGVTVQRVDLSSSHPGGAYLVKNGFQVLLPVSGRLYFEVPEGVGEFQLGISADQRASVALLNPAGKTVMEDGNVNSMTLFTGKRTDVSRSEIWAIEVRNAVWQVTVKMYEPLLPLLSSNPDTLPLKGDPEKAVRGTPPAAKPRQAKEDEGPFRNAGFEQFRNGLPLYWRNPAVPGAKLSPVAEKPFSGTGALRVETPAQLTLMSYSFVKVRPGAKLRTSVQARGRGSFSMELSNYTEKNKHWIRPNTSSPKFQVDSAEWKEFSFESTVSDADSGPDGKCGFVRFLLVADKDSALEFDQCDVKVAE